MKKAHLLVGVSGLLLFLLPGQYMHFALGHLHDMPAASRLLYRSAHIYLLWSSLLNAVLGCYMVKTPHAHLIWLQRFGSGIIMAGPILLCAGFFYEPEMQELARPFSRAAIYLSALGVVMHGFTALSKRG